MPLAASAVDEKFMSNAQRALSRPRAEKLRDLLLGIDTCADVRTIDARLGSP
jgi:hypothetical protein